MPGVGYFSHWAEVPAVASTMAIRTIDKAFIGFSLLPRISRSALSLLSSRGLLGSDLERVVFSRSGLLTRDSLPVTVHDTAVSNDARTDGRSDGAAHGGYTRVQAFGRMAADVSMPDTSRFGRRKNAARAACDPLDASSV